MTTIFEAEVFDKKQDLTSPEKSEGFFVELEAAKTAALEGVYFLDEEPLVNVYEPKGESLIIVGVWWRDRSGPAPVWKYRPENDTEK